MQKWDKVEVTTTAPVIVRLRKGKGLIQTKIWKSSFEDFDNNASPKSYTEAVLRQLPHIKRNIVTVSRQMAQCTGARQNQDEMGKMMLDHFEDALKLQESRGAKAICRNIQYTG